MAGAVAVSDDNYTPPTEAARLALGIAVAGIAIAIALVLSTMGLVTVWNHSIRVQEHRIFLDCGINNQTGGVCGNVPGPRSP